MASDFTKDTTLADMSKLPGISDLASSIKVPFIKALKAEEAGDHTAAETFLAAAVLKEEEFHSANVKK